MTQRDATPEELALARRCADLCGVTEYSDMRPWVVQAALSAIRETTERAADSCSWPVGLEITNEFARGMACSCALNSSALRNNSHLKGEAHA